MKKVLVSAIIPAHNESDYIGRVVQRALGSADEVLVIDDGSSDDTAAVAQAAGARVVRQPPSGYLSAIKRGIREASGNILVTLDGDGEHRPEEIPMLINPIMADKADLVLGRRERIARISERLISTLCRVRVPVHDSGTGFRAFRREVALKLTFPGKCICGTSVLEAHSIGARIMEIPISLRPTGKPRRVAWSHVIQLWYVLKLLFRTRHLRGPQY